MVDDRFRDGVAAAGVVAEQDLSMGSHVAGMLGAEQALEVGTGLGVLHVVLEDEDWAGGTCHRAALVGAGAGINGILVTNPSESRIWVSTVAGNACHRAVP